MALLSGGAADKSAVGEIVRQAFQGPGMLLLENHGFPQAVLDDSFSLSKQFFDAPKASKDQFKYETPRPILVSGTNYPGQRYTVQSKFDTSTGEEQVVNEWLVFREAEKFPYSSTDPYFTSPVGEKIFWPETDGNRRPDLDGAVPGLRDSGEAFHKNIQVLAKSFERALALGLGLDEEYFVSRSSGPPTWPVIWAQYPKQVPSPPTSPSVSPNKSVFVV
jgi:isopenicillin N synthase-like dioxygenase